VNSEPEESPGVAEVMQAAKEVFDTIGNEIFGIEFETAAPGEGMVDDLMSLIIELRAQARRDRNWALSDRIRDRLKEIGITLEDRPDGTNWTKKNSPLDPIS